MTGGLAPGQPDAVLAAEIAALRADRSRRGELVALLAEEAPVYAGLTAEAAERVRAAVFASFEHVGLPPDAVPLVVEELGIGTAPGTVAAAARALRNAEALPPAAPDLLRAAAERMRRWDDVLRLDPPAPAAPDGTEPPAATAVDDILRTARLVETRAAKPASGACCCGNGAAATADPPPGAADMANADLCALAVEDQTGEATTLGAFLHGRPSVLTFFYTRCMNPEKCSSTVAKLASLQRLLREAGLAERVNVAAMTYDPAFDRPDRLRSYGQQRGMRLDARNRLLRGADALETLRGCLGLGVGFGAATVNRHRVELFVLGPDGTVRDAFRRVAWEPGDVLATVARLLD